MTLTNKDRLALVRNGWCLTEACTAARPMEIATALGKPIRVAGGSLTKSLLPQSELNAPKHSMSALYGLKAFPPHTDMAHWHTPARYVLLRCASGRSSTPTLVIDSHDFLTQELREKWTRAVWKIKGIRLPFLCSITSSIANGGPFRWDPCCMFPFNAKAAELKSAVIETLDAALRTVGHTIEWTSPDLLLILDNWRVLHARPSIIDKEDRRELHRILVKGADHG